MGVPVNPHPSDEDLEWLYSSCLLCGKECFRAFRSIANCVMVCHQIQLRGDENRYRILLSADENMKTNSGIKYISEN